MSEWKIKRGNTSIQEIACYDKNDVLLTNLAAATSIRFHVKETKTGSPLIEKTKGDGLAVNTPTQGYIRVTILPTETDIEPATYYMALEIIYSVTEKYECILKINNVETMDFVIEQDVINT